MTEENNQILEAELLEESSEISEPELLKVDIPDFGLVNIIKELIEKYQILEGTKTPFSGFDIVKHIESKEIAPETQPQKDSQIRIDEGLKDTIEQIEERETNHESVDNRCGTREQTK